MLAAFRRFADYLALLALALICAAVFWPLLSGQTFFYGDLQLYFAPMATFWKGELGQGRVPLWNAGILGGTPFVGSPQMWILYPAALLLLVMPAVAALSVSTVLHFWLGGAFFYGWMRRGVFRLRVVPALLGACVWMLCGFVVSKSQFPNMLMAIAWVPAVLWAGEALVARPSARAALILAAVLALQLLAGHAQISLLSGYMLLVLAFYRWRQTGARASGGRVLGAFAGALILAGFLTLGQTLPVVEALGATVRQRLTLGEASRFSVMPRGLITLVLPHYYGDPMRSAWNYPAQVNAWECAAYLGLAPLALAGLALWRERRARFWGAWTALFLWLSLGVFGLLYIVAFYALPGLARFHDAGRFLVGFSVGGAVLAALGAQHLTERAGARWAALALVATLLDLGIYARGFYPTMPLELAQTPPAAPWGEDAFLGARQGRLWQPDFFALWPMFQPIDDFRPGDWANSRAFFAIGPTNRHLLRGWLAESGYEPLYDRAALQRLRKLKWNPRDSSFPPALAEKLGRDSVRIVQLVRPAPMQPSPDWTLIYATSQPVRGQRVFYYRNRKCLPRARWRAGAGAWKAARIVSETAASIALDVPARATQLELADTMRPGWHASANGRALSIETTPESWRRVQLPPAPDGQARRVRFSYAPLPWKLGVWASLCALGFWCAAMMATRARR